MKSAGYDAHPDLTPERAARLLLQRREASRDLVEYARYVDIPSVPMDASEDRWEVIETPLAPHHRLILRVLQAMADGRLEYEVGHGEAGEVLLPLWGDLLNPPPGVESEVGVPFKGATPLSEPQLPNPSNPPQPRMVEPFSESDWSKNDQFSGDIEQKPLTLAASGYVSNIRREVCRRVMIMLPPGSAKSTYASVVFPSWQMGRWGDQEIILSGWGDPICKRHGKRTRQICNQPGYRSVFGTNLDPKTTASEDWSLLNGSSYKSSGVQSGCAGFRCDGLIWDDLTKNRKEADSKTIRDTVYNAYIDDLRSRKKPDAWEVGIGTRWHEDEIMGRILPDGYAGESGLMRCRDGNVWYVICLPAQCERGDDPLGREVGEMIWPEWFGEDYWSEKRVNPRSWGSLYQQRPAPEEGIYFKLEDFRYYDELPEGDTYISFDPAVSEAEDADQTAILIWRVDQFGKIYLLDEWVQKKTMDVWIEVLLRKGLDYKPMEMISEAGVIRRAAEPFIKRASINLKAFFKFSWVTRHADKSAMARAAQGMLAAGNVYIPRNSVGEGFKDECLRFPAGKDDHRVDAFANLCLRLEDIWDARPPKQEEKKSVIIGKGAFAGDQMKVSQFMPPRFPKKRSRWTHRT